MRIEDLDDEDLKHLASGSIESMSTRGLQVLVGESGSVRAKTPDLDIPSEGDDMKDIALGIARVLFAKNRKEQIKETAPLVGKQLEKSGMGTMGEFGLGAMEQRGLAPAGPDSMARSAGKVASQYGPAALGAAILGPIAGRLAPVAVRALPAAANIPALARTIGAGLGASGGEMTAQVAAKAAGGNQPEPVKAAKMGLEAVAAEMGLGTAASALKAVMPAAAQVFTNIPASPIRRAIKRMSEGDDILKVGGDAARADIERQAVGSLGRLQGIYGRARRTAGQGVDNALRGLGVKTNRAPVSDLSSIAKKADAAIEEVAGHSAAEEALKSELGKIRTVVEKMRGSPQATVNDLINIRRAVDDLTTFKAGGMQQVSSESGQKVARLIGSELRAEIKAVSKRFNHKQLDLANDNFSKVANEYDDAIATIGTTRGADRTMLARVKKLGSDLNDGAEVTELLERFGLDLPDGFGGIANKEMNRLLDLLAARELTKLPKGTQSGTLKDAIKFLASPQAIALGIKIGGRSGPAARAGGLMAVDQIAGREIEGELRSKRGN